VETSETDHLCRLKLKRFHVAKRYKAEIDELYAEVAAEDEAKAGRAKL